MKDLHETAKSIQERLQDQIHRFRQYVVDLGERNAGLLYIALAQLFFVCMNTIVKKLASLEKPVPTTQLIAVRMAITCVCCIAWMVWAKVPNPYFGPPEVRGLLVVRGVVGFVGLFGMYNGLHYLSLSDSTIITFLSPSCIALLAYLFLREPFSRQEAICGLISFFGVILIARPVSLFGGSSDVPDTTIEARAAEPTAAQRLGAVAIALLGVFGGAGAAISIRAVGKRAHAMHSIVYFSFYSTVVASIGAYVFKDQWTVPSFGWLAGMLVIGMFGFFAQVLTTLGFQNEAAGRGALGQYTQIIFALIMERMFFHVQTQILSVVGSSLIMCSALYIAIMKPREHDKPAPSETGNTYQVLRTSESGTAEEVDLEQGPLTATTVSPSPTPSPR